MVINTGLIVVQKKVEVDPELEKTTLRKSDEETRERKREQAKNRIRISIKRQK